MSAKTRFAAEELNSIFISQNQLYVHKKPNTLEMYYLSQGEIVFLYNPAILNFKGSNLLPATFVKNLRILLQSEEETGEVITIELWTSYFTAMSPGKPLRLTSEVEQLP